MGGWEENCFQTPSHRHRFLRYYRETFSNQSCAALYLLSADEILWYRAYGHIFTDEISVKNIPLQGISTDGYALYQTAKTITTGKKHIYINEIADDNSLAILHLAQWMCRRTRSAHQTAARDKNHMVV